jgi:hypothetical protein
MIITSTFCLVVAALFGLQVFIAAFLPGRWKIGNALVRILIPLVAGLILRLLPAIDHLAR